MLRSVFMHASWNQQATAYSHVPKFAAMLSSAAQNVAQLSSTRTASSVICRAPSLTPILSTTRTVHLPQTPNASSQTCLMSPILRQFCSAAMHRVAVGGGLRAVRAEISLLTPKCCVVVPAQSYKAKVKLRRRCPHCYYVVRHNRVFVECTEKPRHKQMKRLPKHKIYKED